MIEKEFETETRPIPDTKKQRVEKIYRRLLCFNPTGVMLKPNQEWIPACSSYWLEQFIEEILSSEEFISDLFLWFWKALDSTKAPLITMPFTKAMSRFIKDMHIYSWLRYCWKFKNGNHVEFKSEYFEWMVPLVNKGCTQAQAYLAVRVLPFDLVVNCKEAILRTLEKIDDTDIIDLAQSKLSYCFSQTVPFEQRLEELFDYLKLRNSRGGLVDWNDLSAIYHSIIYCNSDEMLKQTWLKNIVSLDLPPKVIKEAAIEAKTQFERIQKIIINRGYLDYDEWNLILLLRLELEMIKDFFQFRKAAFPPLDLTSLCVKMREISQIEENKKTFELSVNQLSANPRLPFVDIWFQADVAKNTN